MVSIFIYFQLCFDLANIYGETYLIEIPDEGPTVTGKPGGNPITKPNSEIQDKPKLATKQNPESGPERPGRSHDMVSNINSMVEGMGGLENNDAIADYIYSIKPHHRHGKGALVNNDNTRNSGYGAVAANDIYEYDYNQALKVHYPDGIGDLVDDEIDFYQYDLILDRRCKKKKWQKKNKNKCKFVKGGTWGPKAKKNKWVERKPNAKNNKWVERKPNAKKNQREERKPKIKNKKWKNRKWW